MSTADSRAETAEGNYKKSILITTGNKSKF